MEEPRRQVRKCPYCARGDFVNAQALGGHVGRCSARKKVEAPADYSHPRRERKRAKLDGEASEASEGEDGDEYQPPHSHSHAGSEPLLPSSATVREITALEDMAAEACRLGRHEMSTEEREAFPAFAKTPKDTATYLQIRNKIIQLWFRDCHNELNLDRILEVVSDAHKEIVSSVFEWLAVQGYINFGVFHPLSKPPLDPSTQRRRRIGVIGAGMAGLGAARHLTSLGYDVTVFEGRTRVGGRVDTHHHGASIADLGAMVITGLGGNPVCTLAKQINMALYPIRPTCPLYDHAGKRIHEELDSEIEKEFNRLLEMTKHAGRALEAVHGTDHAVSLGQAFDLAVRGEATRNAKLRVAHLEEAQELQKELNDKIQELYDCQKSMLEFAETTPDAPSIFQGGDAGAQVEPMDELGEEKKPAVPAPGSAAETFQDLRSNLERLTAEVEDLLTKRRLLSAEAPAEYMTASARQVLNWHVANLEFANATMLNTLSLTHWDQDDEFEFHGPHLYARDGYYTLPKALSTGLDIRLGARVQTVQYGRPAAKVSYVSEQGESKDEDFDAVIVTVPLGLLKKETIRFEPALPNWKKDAVKRMGFGVLNKVVMFFPRCFWDESVDMFGYCADPKTAAFGENFLFWSFLEATKQPTLIALNAGQAAKDAEELSDDVIISRAVGVLRKMFGADKVDNPINAVVTRWGKEEYTQGSYSYLPMGCLGNDYDLLAAPVAAEGQGAQVFFAGEHTNKNYPATVHGAYLSGLREAANIYTTLGKPIVPKDTLLGDKYTPAPKPLHENGNGAAPMDTQ